jgi:hypothetical protein
MMTTLADQGATYRIQVQGRLAPQWGARLSGLTLAVGAGGGQTAVTVLTGWISDQAALMGVLEQLYALGVPLLSVERLEEGVDGGRGGAP